jgi:FlaA1/EpsC-like NDP-sugar epimerase
MTDEFTAVELQRLLARPPRAAVGTEEREAFRGARVLVTGAAGSIGSALVRELAGCAPAVLALVDHSELGLFTIEREVRRDYPDVAIEAYLMDVTHAASMRRACADTRPAVVFHAAAYKHVTMAERAPALAARTNVFGSAFVARAAAAASARFVLVSSDKAADPASVMGATKRLAEMVTLSMATPAFRPIVVRFGNVIGSSGSVIRVMRECIRHGRSLPLTDPEASRYFMTAGEAVALMLRADRLAASPEVFWLDMGDPVRMGDLADRLVALEADAGFAPVSIEIIGLRPGEKRNETLSDAALTFHRTVDDRILVARQARRPPASLVPLLMTLRRAAASADDRLALEVLAAAIPGFQPSDQARAAGRRSSAVRNTRRRAPGRRGSDQAA